VNLTGILNSDFTASAAIGAISVKLSGANGASIGLSDANFTGGAIGNVLVNVSKGKDPGATARAINGAAFDAQTSLGSLTVLGSATQAQVTGLTCVSGGKIGAVSIKAVQPEFGSLEDSTILAGQALDFTGAATVAAMKAKLLAASLSAFTASGGMFQAIIAAGANLGPVKLGGSIGDSLILAGARLGADRAPGGGNDTFQRAAKIAAVTVGGAFAMTSIAAGVDPVNGVFGDGDDVPGTSEAVAAQGSEIGAVSVGAGTVGTTITTSHFFAIEAGEIAKLLVKGQPPVTSFTQPSLLDIGPPGEDPPDVIVRVV
jgi:hypothetical protein